MNKFAGVVVSLMTMVVVWAQAPPPKQVEIFGQKIQYSEAGSGPTVILLHGLGGDRSNWAYTAPVLAKNYHVFVPDQIGFGESDKPMIDYRVGTLVDFLDGFYKKLGITKAIVVGNSLGGWTALSFTLAHPEKVDRLVLVDSAGYSLTKTGAQAPRELLQVLNPSTVAAEKALMGTILANKAMVTDAFAEGAFAQHMRRGDGYTIDRFLDSLLRNEDVVDGKLGAIKVPTLVVWGREDGLIPLSAGQMMGTEIAGSQTVILDHCGHVPQIECAVLFNTALLKFLAGGAGTSTAGIQ
jgi:2-hydroxy-6-oxonona-2,4-dienedioate hydrolase